MRPNSGIAPALALCALVLAGCSTPPEPVEVYDPYEPVNRATHGFNKVLDTVALRPVSQVYGTIVPEPARTGVDNAVSNLGLPSAVLNKTLQGDVEGAVHNAFRFLINSTLGVFGLFDPAGSSFGLEEREATFGDTLAHYDVREGAYLVLPLLGPSTQRDSVGLIVDTITDPLRFFAPEVDNDAAGASIATALNGRYLYTDTIDGVLYDSADSYVQMRLFYLESRRFDLGGGQSTAAVTDIYEDLYSDLYSN